MTPPPLSSLDSAIDSPERLSGTFDHHFSHSASLVHDFLKGRSPQLVAVEPLIVPEQPGSEEYVQLAKVIYLHPEVTPYPWQTYHYAPVENAELQAQDNMRQRLLKSVRDIRDYREQRQKDIADGKHVERFAYGPGVIEENERLAITTDDMFWVAYSGAIAARHA